MSIIGGVRREWTGKGLVLSSGETVARSWQQPLVAIREPMVGLAALSSRPYGETRPYSDCSEYHWKLQILSRMQDAVRL